MNKRLLLAQLAAAETLIEAMKLAIEEPDVASEDVRPGKRCPRCGEDERLEDTSPSTTERRMTCLACGQSWTFAVTLSEVAANG